ncbi:MAG: hypothetical protein JNJ48_02525, partial [Phycisphaerae bacterium]|nr:hypothetical protein [Phycisphaerae bacterium]
MPAAAQPEPDHDLWSRLLAHLRQAQPEICRQWFEEIEPLGVDGGVLRLRAHSPVHRDYLNRQCTGPFNDAARSVSGRLITVRFLGPEDDLAAAKRSARAAASPSATPAAPARPAATPQGPVGAPPPVLEPATLVDEELPPPGAPPVRAVQESAEHLYDDGLVLNPDYGFEHFV